MTDTYKPSWVPEEENDKFACRVMYGVTGGHEGTPGVTVDKKDKVTPAIKRRKLEVDDYVEGVLKCDRAILSRAITLVESNAAAHFETAQQVIQKLLPYTGKSTRVGITGVPVQVNPPLLRLLAQTCVVADIKSQYWRSIPPVLLPKAVSWAIKHVWNSFHANRMLLSVRLLREELWVV